MKIANFDERLNGFLKGADKIIQEHDNHSGYYLPLETEERKRYVKLILVTKYSSTSVYCFVDKTNGDILKGTWKSPVVNGVRGNIFADDYGLSCVDWHGCTYLR